jgi:hypothetical protein
MLSDDCTKEQDWTNNLDSYSRLNIIKRRGNMKIQYVGRKQSPGNSIVASHQARIPGTQLTACWPGKFGTPHNTQS